MFTTIELFAGAGGLALGIEKAGFRPIGLIEFNKDAAHTLQTNRPNWNVICNDISNISAFDLERFFSIEKQELDLLSGGAPCQSLVTLIKQISPPLTSLLVKRFNFLMSLFYLPQNPAVKRLNILGKSFR